MSEFIHQISLNIVFIIHKIILNCTSHRLNMLLIDSCIIIVVNSIQCFEIYRKLLRMCISFSAKNCQRVATEENHQKSLVKRRWRLHRPARTCDHCTCQPPVRPLLRQAHAASMRRMSACLAHSMPETAAHESAARRLGVSVVCRTVSNCSSARVARVPRAHARHFAAAASRGHRRSAVVRWWFGGERFICMNIFDQIRWDLCICMNIQNILLNLSKNIQPKSLWTCWCVRMCITSWTNNLIIL